MAAKRINTIDLINTLRGLNKEFFTIADMEKITGLPRQSLKVALSRLTKSGVLVRLSRGIYQLSILEVDVKKIANQLYYPSYLSFESALSLYGILSQIPYTQTFAALKKSKKMTLYDTEVEFTQLKEELFFGYKLEQGIYIAEPEKALLDQLYLVSRGKRNISVEELDFKNINKARFIEYAARFPSYTRPLVTQVKKYLGTTPVGLETKERIVWSK